MTSRREGRGESAEAVVDQDKVFVEEEGDAWFLRNRASLLGSDLSSTDIPLELIKDVEPPPVSVLEVGCATGWRLAALSQQIDTWCVGVDVSQEALIEGARTFGRQRSLGPMLVRARASALPFSNGAAFEVVIASFVLHWIDRRHLLSTVAEIDRCVSNGGWLIIADFLPGEPVKVAYHHRPGSGLFTYKQDYSSMFLASGLYRLEKAIVFDHDDPSVREEIFPRQPRSTHVIADTRRAGAFLLKKVAGGIYKLDNR